MSKRAFDKIMAGMEDALAIAEGRAQPGTYRVHIPDGVDVRAIRKRLRLTQEAFAARYGFSVGRVRDWEQGRTAPEPAHRLWLTVIDREPEAVSRALKVA